MTLSEVYAKFQAPDGGGDKGTAHSYIEIYEAEMPKTKGISLLEIGIWEGHSIAMWQEFFTDSEIIGVDISLDRLRFDLKNAVMADATKPILELQSKQFDYVIDDGSHKVEHQKKSFEWLWPLIKPGGRYFIEDVVSSIALNDLLLFLENQDLDFRVFDHREKTGRYDDILLVVYKQVN